MQLGMLGLGRMGANLVRRLMKDGHDCVVYDANVSLVADLEREGASGALNPGEFVAKLSAPRIVWGRRVLPLTEGDNVLGRDEDVAIHIDDASVSRHHAVVRVRGDEVTIEDLGSKNGTFLKDARLEGVTRLEDGDVFAVGELALLLRTGPLPGPTATAARGRG